MILTDNTEDTGSRKVKAQIAKCKRRAKMARTKKDKQATENNRKSQKFAISSC